MVDGVRRTPALYKCRQSLNFWSACRPRRFIPRTGGDVLLVSTSFAINRRAPSEVVRIELRLCPKSRSSDITASGVRRTANQKQVGAHCISIVCHRGTTYYSSLPPTLNRRVSMTHPLLLALLGQCLIVSMQGNSELS